MCACVCVKKNIIIENLVILKKKNSSHDQNASTVVVFPSNFRDPNKNLICLFACFMEHIPNATSMFRI